MDRLSPRLRRVVAAGLAAAAAVVALAGCSVSPPTAIVRVLAGSATLDGTAIAGDERADSGAVIEVAPGDAVVELQWRDGAFTRLAGGAQFTVGGASERGTLTGGTAWNAVGPDAGKYAIATADGAVAAAGATTFVLRCGDTCDGVTSSGSVTLPGGAVVPSPDRFVVASGATAPATWDQVFADPFATANAARDQQAGLPSAASQWAGLPASAASLVGTYDGPETPVSQTCTGWADECARVQQRLFAATPQPYTITADCSAGPPCSSVIAFTLVGTQGSTRTFTAPLTFDGIAYSATATITDGVYCTLPDGSTQGTWTNTRSVRLTPTATSVVNGVLVATSVAGESSGGVTPVTTTTDPSCVQYEYQWQSDTTRDLTLRQTPLAATVALDPGAAAPAQVAGAARASVLSDLKQPAAAVPTFEQASIMLATIVVLVLVLAFPGYLLTRVVTDRFESAGERRRARRRERPGHPVLALLALVVGTIVASLIAAALDPGFGAGVAGAWPDPAAMAAAVGVMAVDPGTLRLLGSTLLSFLVFTLGAALAVRLAGPGVRMRAQFRWGSLVVLLAGVVVSRVIGLNPGVIFGLVAGIVILDSLPPHRQGRLALVAALYAVVIGAAAWTGYAVLAPIVAGDPQNALLVGVSETLAALTLEAASTLPLTLLPVAGFDGGALREWRIGAWALAYAAGLALFLVTIAVVPGSWVQIQGDAIRWAIGFAAFTVVAMAIWALHVAQQRRAARRA